jgi:hypothetical protein
MIGCVVVYRKGKQTNVSEPMLPRQANARSYELAGELASIGVHLRRMHDGAYSYYGSIKNERISVTVMPEDEVPL